MVLIGYFNNSIKDIFIKAGEIRLFFIFFHSRVEKKQVYQSEQNKSLQSSFENADNLYLHLKMCQATENMISDLIFCVFLWKENSGEY